ncbi:MAG: hypothetical protein AAGN35_04210 [Bacteroidota bacterium]
MLTDTIELIGGTEIGEFEIKTKGAVKTWAEISMKKVFANWMDAHDYKEEYFADPTALVDQLEYHFKGYATDFLSGGLNLILRFYYGILFCLSSAIFSPIARAMDAKMSFDGKKICARKFHPPILNRL